MPRELPIYSEIGELYLDKPTPEGVISSCRLLDGLSKSSKALLLAECHLAYAERGDQLWIAGEDSRFFVIIGKGILRLTRNSPQFREIAVEVLGPGCHAGILALCAETSYPLTATSVTPLWYLKVHSSVWNDVMKNEPGLPNVMIKHSSERLIQSLDFMANMISGEIEHRIAFCLLKVHLLLNHTESQELDKTIIINIQSLAELACTSVESTTRVTIAWQKKGWIKKVNRSIKVLRPDALELRARQIVSPVNF
jgi:CRP-like cAMP-binding protein